MNASAVFLVVGASGPAGRALPGVQSDARRWARRLQLLGGPKAKVMELGEGPATAEAIRGLAQQAGAMVSDTGRMVVVALGHGGPTANGRPGMWSDDGEVVALESLAAHAPATATVEWFVELCGAGGPRSVAQVFRPGDVVHSACAPHQVAEQALVDGKWCGAWSNAAHLVLDHFTGTDALGQPVTELSHTEFSQRVATVLGALGLDQTPTLTGPAERLTQRLDGRSVEMVAGPERLAMQFGMGNGIVLLDGTTPWVAAHFVSGDLVWLMRSGETVSSMPNNLTLAWRNPTGGEISQLGGPTFTCSHVTFTNVGTAHTPSNGRRYSSGSRTFVLAFGSGFDKVFWWTESSELDANDYITGSGTESMTRITSTPSAPSGGWERAIDKP